MALQLRTLVSVLLLIGTTFVSFAGAGTIADVNRLTVVYPVDACDAFVGNTGKEVSCAALSDTALLDREGVICVLQLTSCEELVRRRRSLLQLTSELTIVVDVSEDVADFNATIQAGEDAAADPEGFRDNVITEWSDSDAPDKAQRIQLTNSTIISAGQSTVEVVPPFPNDCENNADCSDNPYGLAFCLVRGTVDAPITNICVECLESKDCEVNETCSDSNECVPENR